MNTLQVREHFRAQVHEYAELMHRLIPFYETQSNIMLSLLPVERASPLRELDLGCGPGLMAVPVLAEFPQPTRTLVYLPPEMAYAGRRRLMDHGNLNVHSAGLRTKTF